MPLNEADTRAQLIDPRLEASGWGATQIGREHFYRRDVQYTATQTRFLRAVRSQVLRQVALNAQDLQRPPFTRIGDVNRLFDTTQVQEILNFANQLTLAA